MKIRLHAFEPYSRANGPGVCAVVWVQGCSLSCPGCFNPATHSARGGYESDTVELAERIGGLLPKISGLTISGGEPLQQSAAVIDLLRRAGDLGLGRHVFTGYSMAEIESMPGAAPVLQQVDLLIAGRYDRDQHQPSGMVSSRNQQVHYLSDRYHPRDLQSVPRRELILKGDGTLVASGIVGWDRPGTEF